MSKKKLLLNKIADHNKKLAELQKQIKDMEITEQMKVGEAVLEMYRSGKWDADKLKTLVVGIIGDEVQAAVVHDESKVSDSVDNLKSNSEREQVVK